MGTLAQLFESGEQTSKKGHFRNLVLLARLDGSIADTERNFLNRMASRLSLTEEQVKEILSDPMAYPVVPPISLEERCERLIALVEMANIDGIIAPEELSLINCLAIALGLTEEFIAKNLSFVIDNVKNQIDRNEILEVLVG
jgi:uncharacterized tellurite resistance protein B-like protein